MTKKMARYLNWLQHDTRIFNVGERRRVAAGSASRPLTAIRVGSATFPDLVQLPDFNPTTLDQRLKQSRKPVFGSPSPTTTVLVNGELPAEEISADILPPPALDATDFVDVEPSDHTNGVNGNGVGSAPMADMPPEDSHNAPDAADHSAKFFDPENAEASVIREQLAMETLDELLDFLLYHNGSVGIFDATNSTLERRKNITDKIRQRAGPELGVLFLESQCIDENVGGLAQSYTEEPADSM